MNIPKLDEEITEKIIKAFCCIDAHILMNLYANENTAFGHIKANESTPFNKYSDDLGLQSFSRYLDLLHLDGHAIVKGCIKD